MSLAAAGEACGDRAKSYIIKTCKVSQLFHFEHHIRRKIAQCPSTVSPRHRGIGQSVGCNGLHSLNRIGLGNFAVHLLEA